MPTSLRPSYTAKVTVSEGPLEIDLEQTVSETCPVHGGLWCTIRTRRVITYLALGTYILVVNDITEPPFITGTLPPLTLTINLVTPRLRKEPSSIERLTKGRSRLPINK